jgi:hypothetical protein
MHKSRKRQNYFGHKSISKKMVAGSGLGANTKQAMDTSTLEDVTFLPIDMHML